MAASEHHPVGWPALDPSSHPRTWLEVDGEALANNTRRTKELARGLRLLVVLKADAYGHGAAEVLPTVRSAGADWIGVGDSAEALRLREAGDRGPLLILGAIVPSEIAAVVEHGITPVVHSRQRLAEIEAEAERQGVVVDVHLKVDSGMGRLGMRPARLEEAVRRVLEAPHLRLGGLMSHMAGSGDARRANRAQRLRFARCLQRVQRAGAQPTEVHWRNSVGLADAELAIEGETLVRSGAWIFGFAPPGCERLPGFRSTLAWRAQLAFLKDVPAGSRVGYEGAHRCRRDTRLAVLPVGYHDGLPRGAGQGGVVLLRGRRAPILGRVSMDYTTIDVTDIPGAATGDVATLVGSDGAETQTIQELAEVVGSIPHEMLCTLGPRVVRRRAPRAGEPS